MTVNEICSICRDDIPPRDKRPIDPTAEKIVQIACTHEFHQKCLYNWAILRAICPLCQMEITPDAQKELFGQIVRREQPKPLTIEEIKATGVEGFMLADIYLP